MEISSEEDEPEAHSRPAKIPKSRMWNYFEKLSDKESSCNARFKKLQTPTGVTSSMKKHLKQHPVLFQEFTLKTKEDERNRVGTAKQTQGLITSHFKKPIAVYSNSSIEKRNITAAIAKMMATDYQPYSIVEDRGFCELVRLLDQRYEMPSRTTFSRHFVPDVYKKKKTEIQDVIKLSADTLSSASFTTDGWTSRANDSYIGVTLHYLDSRFKYHSFTLNNKPFPGNHRAEDIKKVILDIAEDWSIPSTIPIYVVTDNARNYSTAFNHTTWHHLPCFAHSLQLAIHDANRDTLGVSNLFAKARAIAGHYKRSPLANDRLQQIQKNNGSGNVLQLIQDVSTRWNSEFFMLERLIKLRAPIATELAQSSSHINSLSAQEFELAGSIVTVLQPFAVATQELCGDVYPTLSMVLPVLHCLDKSLDKHIENALPGTTYARALARSLRTRFASTTSLANKIPKLATLVDPRFKGVLFDAEEVEILLIEELERREVQLNIQNDANIPVPTVTDVQPISDGLWSSFDTLSQSQEHSENRADIMKREVQRYLQDPVLPRSTNSYKWWADIGLSQYPFLSKVALQYLSIPATQVNSERLFSTAGNIVTSRRECLAPEHVEQLTFLHDNL